MKFSVASLRRQGHKVRVSHKRPFLVSSYSDEIELLARHEAEEKGVWDTNYGPLQAGGITSVEITYPNGETVRGEAKCSDDQGFYKQLGTYIAVGRALGEHPTEQDFLAEKKAQAIVNEVLFNLHLRQGVGSTLDNIPEEEYIAIEDSLVELVKSQL
jgi:hypothetical protein